MSRKLWHAAGATLVLGVAWLVTAVAGQSPGRNPVSDGTKYGEWPHYTGDLRGTRYSPLDQINASNFSKLEVAWRFKTDNLGTRPEFKLEGTPLMVNGVLYATAGTRRAVVALDAKTGELLWVHSLREGARAVNAPRQLSGRGLAYWTDGKGDERILYVTMGYRLVALNAKTGSLISSFGDGGIVDLKVGMYRGTGEQIDLETGEAGLHATPTVVKDVVIVGSAFMEGFTPRTHNNTKGVVRAFDVRTGKLLWRFDTIPKPGEFGNETWLNGSWAVNGNTGVWTQITVDEELGLVYLPVESPTSDIYGGHRPGQNLFAESLVCVDLKTGKRKWHFQFVHHPLWDLDMSSAPILADVVIEGKPRKVVAVPSKQSFLYVFDRVTGEPIWPIVEKPVPVGDVPGEWYSTTQPFPPEKLQYARNYLKVPDDLIDFTPELRQQALKILERYKNGPLYNPPIVGRVDGILGAINIGNASGGTNWPGGGYDPETRTVFVPAGNAAVSSFSVAPPPPEFSDLKYLRGRIGEPFRESFGPGYGSAADFPRQRLAEVQRAEKPDPRVVPLNVEGLPLVKPPYGLLAAIDLERGEVKWAVPHGDTPDAVRNHPKLKGLDIPKTGQPGTSGVGLVVTKTLVIMGDPQVTAPPGRPRGAMLRAYDKATGQEVGAVWMPAQQSGSPMTYMVDGRQYIVVAISGGNYSGEYLAFRLPEPETTTSGDAARER